MPVLDMPLEKLKQYQGRNPRPADFDEYWDKAIAEMHALGTGCELVPSDFKVPGVAKCYDMYFTGVGGARVHAKYLLPEKRQGRVPAIIEFHGYTGSCGEWNDKLNYTALGFAVLALDCRGQGGTSEDTSRVACNTHNGHIIRGLMDEDPEKLYYRAQFLDTAQLARIAMAQPEIDENRVGAIGGSQGGALTLACAALEPKVSRIMSKMPFLCDYQRVWEMDLALDAYAELKWFFRTYDPQHKREQEIFTRLGYIDVQYLAPRICADTLMITGLMDNICPPSTQFAAYNKIRANKSMEIYPDFGHENMNGAGDQIMQYMLKM